MPITTLKIGLLNHAELQQLAAITRTVNQQSDQRLSMLDPNLIAKLERSMENTSMRIEINQLRGLAHRLQIDESTQAIGDSIKVERYRKYGVKVKYYDQSAA